MFTAMLEKLMAGQDLESTEMTEVMDALMKGELTPAQIGALLTALRAREFIALAILTMSD